MNWSLSEYNLIVYGRPEFEIFVKQKGSSRFEEGRLFGHTSSHLKTRYKEDVGRLSELPTLVAAEIRHNKESPTPAFLSSIDSVRKRGKYIAFQFNHLHKISSEEIFESDYFDIERFERHRTHWAVKEGNLLDSFFELLRDSYEDNHHTETPGPSDWVWQCIHPRVAKLARPRFEDGYYGEAVEASYKEVNEVVKQIVRDVAGRELDGAGLMTTAFSPNNPLIELTELETTTDQDIQKGYMQIMAGAMTGIRNPKAHGNLNPPASEALHLICLASLLMHKIDERKSPK